MSRRPGYLVECKDGKIGRTYNDLPLHEGKVQVFVFADSREDLHNGKTIDPPEKRLCDLKNLKIIGFID